MKINGVRELVDIKSMRPVPDTEVSDESKNTYSDKKNKEKF